LVSVITSFSSNIINLFYYQSISLKLCINNDGDGDDVHDGGGDDDDVRDGDGGGSRLELRAGNCNVYSLVKLYYGREKWSKEQFFNRGKKANQRKLFIILRKSFPYFHILENYRHQKIQLFRFVFE
jgi:hypothetical protein